MTISLYDATVLGFLQTIHAARGFMQRGLDHCAQKGLDPEELVETRLYPDMLPFRFQILAVIRHSVDAIENAKKGVCGPMAQSPPLDYRALQKELAKADETLSGYSRADLEDLCGREVIFEVRDFKMVFTAESFLLSFSIPNFHFHATTAYDILRSKGVLVGKLDYLGQLRVKQQ